jgi:hypothetical protein
MTLEKPNQPLSALVSRPLASSGKSAASTVSSVFSTESAVSDVSSAYSDVSSAYSDTFLTNNAIPGRKAINMESMPRGPQRTHPFNLDPLEEERTRDMEKSAPTTAPLATVSFRSELSKQYHVAGYSPLSYQGRKTPSTLGWNKDTPQFYHLVIDEQGQPYFALKSEYRGKNDTEQRVDLDEG